MLRFWLERQRYDRVVDEGRKLLARDPEDPDLHRILAIALWSQGDPKLGEHHLRESLRIDPNDSTSHALLALLRSNPLASRSSDRDAIAALALDPESVLAWHALGHSALADDSDFSMRCARRMLQLDPQNIEARILMFIAVSMDEEKPGWRESAEGWLQEGLAIEPENAQLHGHLGGFLIDTPKRGKEGEAHLHAALLLAPMSSLAAGWREAIVRKRDWGLRLLNFPKKTCIAPISFCGRAMRRYPLLLLLGKFYLALVVICLVGLVLWLIFFWPVVWIYQRYGMHGDLLRAKIAVSRFRRFIWLVPTQAWLRRLIAAAALPLWWQLVSMIFGGIERLHPQLHQGNVVAIAISMIAVGAVGLLLWMEIRRRGRQRAMRGISIGP